jgi:molybdenum cofactor biosynthesis enzyme MoaA
VGIISAVSNHFCQTCNRVRLTAKGDLILCLGQEDAISLKDAVRSDLTNDEIKNIQPIFFLVVRLSYQRSILFLHWAFLALL